MFESERVHSEIVSEFDQYCKRNNVPFGEEGPAMEAFLREYLEEPDIRGRPCS